MNDFTRNLLSVLESYLGDHSMGFSIGLVWSKHPLTMANINSWLRPPTIPSVKGKRFFSSNLAYEELILGSTQTFFCKQKNYPTPLKIKDNTIVNLYHEQHRWRQTPYVSILIVVRLWTSNCAVFRSKSVCAYCDHRILNSIRRTSFT